MVRWSRCWGNFVVGIPNDWDRYFPALLFAYREVPQASLGFSPFELLYGRTVKKPMPVLKHLWMDDKAETEVRSTWQYIVDLANRLEEVCKLARENLQVARKRQAFYYNKKTKERNFTVGDKVFVLLPLEYNKLCAARQGPYDIIEVLTGNNYRVRTGRKEKTYHANLLKLYHQRDMTTLQYKADNRNTQPENQSAFVCATILTEETEDWTSEGTTIPSCSIVES